MAVGTQTAHELTQETVAKLLVQPLEAASTFLQAGPRIFDVHGAFRIPKMGGATNPQWIAENQQIPDVSPDFEEVTMLPDTLLSVKTLTRYSSELARQSVVALDAALQARLVKDVADVIDTQFWSASGDGTTKPRGIFAQPGIQKLPVGGPLTLDALLDAQAMALEANADTTAMKYVMTPRDFSLIRKAKDAQERYQLTPDPTQPGRYTLFGLPVVLTNRLPDTTGATPTGRALLADFSQLAVARDQSPSVKILDQTFGDFDQLAIRVTCRMDMAVLNGPAVIALEGIARS